MMTTKTIVCLLAWALLLSARANAVDRENLSTEELLIQKLEHVYANLEKDDFSKIPVALRLADLYAERARVTAMKELEGGCTVCTAADPDREKALHLYEAALASATPAQRGRVLIQAGHLNELLGREKQAIAYYEQAEQDKDAVLAAEAHLSLAEIYFKQNNFKRAKSYYTLVLQEEKAASLGLAAYRSAWCDFNMDKIASAKDGLRLILTTPKLQTKNGVSNGQVDQQFMEETSRELATWMARTEPTRTEVEELARLSPNASRQANLMTLARELERTGKKASSAQVWQIVQTQTLEPAIHLEAQVRLTALMFSSDDTSYTLKSLQTAAAEWNKLKGCGKSDCDEMQKILRNVIVNWNQGEKKSVSGNLMKAYVAYTDLFPQDAEMALWGAAVAKTRSEWAQSIALLNSAACAFAKDETKLESTLLTALETAELSKSSELWEKSANLYLSSSPKKTKSAEVRYQLARRLYDAEKYADAQKALHNLAADQSMPEKLRIQAAHLELDTLALLKQDAGVASLANTYAKMFADEAEFSKIAYKASMNDVARMATENPAAAFAALSALDVSNASAEDQKIYFKNKIVLAERNGNFAVASEADEQYLALSNLKADEREWGMSKKAWLSEMRLDFATALKSTQGLKSTLKPDQKALKLAIYADLSGTDSKAFYQQYMSLSHDDAVKTAIATQLVRKSANPMEEIKRHGALLAKDPELLARLYTEVYVKAPSEKLLRQILSDKRIEKTAWGQSLARIARLAELKPLTASIAEMKLDAANQSKMTKSIKARAAALQKFEKFVGQTLKTGDWTSEVVSLAAFAKENERFYQELLTLPMPEGLSPEEESQYLSLLTQQAAPYKEQAEKAKSKVQELWATAGWSEALQKSLNESGEFKDLVTAEVESLKVAAGETELAALGKITYTAPETTKPSSEALEAARQSVRDNPLDSARVAALLKLESQVGNFAMVRYLEERLKSKAQEQSL